MSYIPRGAIQISKRFYWLCDSQPPANLEDAYYFCIDQELVYEPFNQDFGPLNLAHLYRYCTDLENLIHDKNYKDLDIVHYCSSDPILKVNAAFLCCAFQIIVLKRNAHEALRPFNHIQHSFLKYRDASMGDTNYRCSIIDVLKGLEYAIQLGWFDYNKFNLKEYEHYEKVENGDLNWIIPGKMIAFSTPCDKGYSERLRTLSSENYVPVLKKFNVKTVIRLNKPLYNEQVFKRNGIDHHDLFFVDGSCPSEAIVKEFLKICEQTKDGVVAIHCKAGLGRTGTLIGCYAMKHFHFPAASFIGWCRIARPGSVLGPQQQFLNEIQSKCFSWTSNDIKSHGGRNSVSKLLPGSGKLEYKVEYSEHDRQIAMYGDKGQAENLLRKKRATNSVGPRVNTYSSTFNDGDQGSSVVEEDFGSKYRYENRGSVNSSFAYDRNRSSMTKSSASDIMGTPVRKHRGSHHNNNGTPVKTHQHHYDTRSNSQSGYKSQIRSVLFHNFMESYGKR